jgi:hypothetical protein
LFRIHTGVPRVSVQVIDLMSSHLLGVHSNTCVCRVSVQVVDLVNIHNGVESDESRTGRQPTSRFGVM